MAGCTRACSEAPGTTCANCCAREPTTRHSRRLFGTHGWAGRTDTARFALPRRSISPGSKCPRLAVEIGSECQRLLMWRTLSHALLARPKPLRRESRPETGVAREEADQPARGHPLH